MTTNMPAALDAFVDPVSSDTLSGPGLMPHSKQHDQANDAILAMEKITVGPVFVNAKGTGAVGNGTVDDTSNLQTTLTAAAGRTWRVPRGTYKITSALVVPPGTSILADGPQNSILKAAASMAHMLIFSDGVAAAGGASVMGLGLDCNGFAIKGFNIRDCVDRVWINCFAKGATDVNWLLNTTQNNLFLACRGDAGGTAGQEKSGNWRLNNGAGGNTFIRCEGASGKPHNIVIAQNTSYDVIPAGLTPGVSYYTVGPSHNTWYHGNFEYSVTGTISSIYARCGQNNNWHNVGVLSTGSTANIRFEFLDVTGTVFGYNGFHDCFLGGDASTTILYMRDHGNYEGGLKWNGNYIQTGTLGFNLDDSQIVYGLGNVEVNLTTFFTTTGAKTQEQLFTTDHVNDTHNFHRRAYFGAELFTYQQAATPTAVVVQTAAGVGATASPSPGAGSNDTRMVVTLVTGTGTGTGRLFRVNYGAAKSHQFASVLAMPHHGGGQGAGFADMKSYIEPDANGFWFCADVAPTASTTFLIMFLVVT